MVASSDDETLIECPRCSGMGERQAASEDSFGRIVYGESACWLCLGVGAITNERAALYRLLTGAE